MWRLNDLEYFEAPGLAVIVFQNTYPEGKQGGIEIIQHGERVATNGDLRLEPTPGQWGELPEVRKREVDAERNMIRVSLSYSKYNLDYAITVRAYEDSIIISVDLDKPLEKKLEGKVGLNLELFPAAYFGKTYHLGETFRVFPRQANGPMISTENGELRPAPLASGRKLSVAPEDPLRRMSIEQLEGGEIKLFDGRNTAQNGWFVVRSLLPLDKTKDAIKWKIKVNSVPEWRRKPVIGISQVGYHPYQTKKAVIELDPRTEKLSEAVLLRIDPEKGLERVFSSAPKKWGKFLHYIYAVFDFTHVREPGLYIIQYESESTPPFKISSDIYKDEAWRPTLETYFPVQMCHMRVQDRYRVWHGACHLDDALQAPLGHVHFDSYKQGSTTETPYSADQHIPYLDRGGWHDAGDYDLAAGSQAQTVFLLSLAREEFNIDTDQTTVRKDERLVILHTPDGIPDIVQQIAHGVENLLSGYRAAGHSFSGIISRRLDQYVHLGDAAVMTDNKIYDSSLKPNETSCERSGRLDDRWAFTSRDTSLEYKVVTALAAASRVLCGYEDDLSRECLETAIKAWEYEQTHPPAKQPSAYVPGNPEIQEIFATVELLITTREERFSQRLIELLPVIEENIHQVGWTVARALPLVKDEKFRSSVKQKLEKYQSEIEQEISKNPYHVPFRPAIWGIGWNILYFAVGQYYLHKAFPEIFDGETVFAVVNYILGCHPASNVSLVSGVGARSLTIAYGFNRADWSYIPGAVASGTALIRPEFPELKENFPFIWQQTENVIGGAASYIFCVQAANRILEEKTRKKSS
ncbi:glycoside hydrolase [Candidatus Bathyarchaeota archaeon]|nr:MAG: glycoside hydrolase [Candidatus Bathyarchaeota archaeon]